MRAFIVILLLVAQSCFGQAVLQKATIASASIVNLPAIIITSPQQYQVIQRTGTTADISIAGIVTTGSHSVEARFNGGNWATVATDVRGPFSATLTNQSQGQGTLELRYVDAPTQSSYVESIGIGDVFLIAGQSNAMGPSPNLQTNAFGTHYLFAKNYTWIASTVDPTDTSGLGGVVDSVGDNGLNNARGSVWPLVAGRFATNNLGFPIAFVPCARDGSSSAQWQPSGSATNRSTLLGSAIWRGKYAVGGFRAVLWWQGETDAVQAQSTAYYYTNLTNITATVKANAGASMMSAKLQHYDGLAQIWQDQINAAIGQAWSQDTNSVTGPDLTGLTTDNGFHFFSSALLDQAAALWWAAIKTAFYP